LKLEAIEKAIAKVIRHETERNIRAFNIGRKIVERPDLFVVEPTHEIESATKAFRRKGNSLRAVFGTGRRGKRIAKQWRVLMKQTFRNTKGLHVDDELMRDFVIRAYDCLIWGGIDYAKRYCEQLVAVFKKDDEAHGYALTRAVVWNLAKSMLIKDEVYTAALLTNPEKYKRDRRRFNVNPERGDRIIYKHHNRPEFEVFGKNVRFEWKSRDWQLRLMSQMRFLRNLLPKWHRREREFRDWYEGLVEKFVATGYKSPRDYQRWLAILSVPEPVTGFREVRYPKMEAAKLRAEKLLATDPELFEPAAMQASQPASQERSVALPVFTSAGA
jgi:indolepyruvate ferredoxin oxidoreductase